MQENVINFLTFFTIHPSLLEILSKQYAYERPTEFKILFVCKSDHETITKKKCQGPKRQKMSWTVWMMGMQVYITLHNFFQEKTIPTNFSSLMTFIIINAGALAHLHRKSVESGVEEPSKTCASWNPEKN